ncbi:heme o synthase [Acidipila sp. 4G-K13]|uniref:Protoheme IX farnesyltransferase n=1 Tax=Paracidobacterium acidisoli TaxID=2303751 RepID=A0A372IRU2_9BACT|nr:heme o synthase [Paracidobacterium acidisoli]
MQCGVVPHSESCHHASAFIGCSIRKRKDRTPVSPAVSGVSVSEIKAVQTPHSEEKIVSASHHLHGPRAGETASLLADYRELFKLRVTLMVMLTAWAGFYLGSMRSGISSMQPGLLEALFGIGMVSAGSAALNECIERRLDAKMIRTANRPLASGRISLPHGILLGMLAVAVGTVWLTRETNLLTGTLTLLTAFLYVAVYTPLKRVTSLATFIGAFPGALPPLLGWVAARGQIEWPAVALFAILFVWQFPHFMSIAWLYREDYGRAGIRMLPVVQPDGWSTVLEALTYAILMIPVSLLPVWLHVAGRIYGGVALVLGLIYLGYTIRFGRIIRARTISESKMYARDLLKVSVIYLPLLLTALMLNATGK